MTKAVLTTTLEALGYYPAPLQAYSMLLLPGKEYQKPPTSIAKRISDLSFYGILALFVSILPAFILCTLWPEITRLYFFVIQVATPVLGVTFIGAAICLDRQEENNNRAIESSQPSTPDWVISIIAEIRERMPWVEFSIRELKDKGILITVSAGGEEYAILRCGKDDLTR